ncbi:uncharacterized protein [Blastocystis hominis]|uniref:Uncharacterized protein n=1 Tax=Blastocystis hominis TaxID=12968 RepID=D8MA91_BLAHO|nr:uncharacterized protein [Blastocystis hominis]CBK24980.2 unnamed protein product [Blastocystis hominis]|eukprot:XP_012899028.1 uncharacterized protein [Blastocystis hominis]
MDTEKHDSQNLKENKSLFGRPASPEKMLDRSKEALFLRLESYHLQIPSPGVDDTEDVKTRSKKDNYVYRSRRHSQDIPIKNENVRRPVFLKEGHGFTDDMYFAMKSRCYDDSESESGSPIPPHLIKSSASPLSFA